MRIDEFEFQDRNGTEIEPTKNQLVVYIKSLHKQIAELQKQLKSQPAEIVEKIKEQIFNHFNVKNIEEYERLSLLDSLFTADAVNEILDTILIVYIEQKQ